MLSALPIHITNYPFYPIHITYTLPACKFLSFK